MEDQARRKKAWEDQELRRRRREEEERRQQWDDQQEDVTRYPNSTIEEEGPVNGETAITYGQDHGNGWTKGFTGGRGVILAGPMASVGPTPVRQTSTPVDMYMSPRRGRGRPPPGFNATHVGMTGGTSPTGPREDTSQDARIAQQMASEPVEMDTRYDAQMAEHVQIQLTEGEAQWQAEEQALQRGTVKSAIYTPKDP